MVVSATRGLQYRPQNTIIFNKESLEALDDTSKPKKGKREDARSRSLFVLASDASTCTASEVNRTRPVLVDMDLKATWSRGGVSLLCKLTILICRCLWELGLLCLAHLGSEVSDGSPTGKMSCYST